MEQLDWTTVEAGERGRMIEYCAWCECFAKAMEGILQFGFEGIPIKRLQTISEQAFHYNIWSDLHLIGGRDVLDTEDFLVSNLLLPIGSLVYLLFCVSKWGWGFDKYIAEVNKGTGIRISPKLKPYFQWILPILILIILVQGLI